MIFFFQYARENALITHAHIKGVNGAIIQAEAVLKALGLQQRNLDQDKFVDDLVKLAQRLEQEHDTGPEETDDKYVQHRDYFMESALVRDFHMSW